MQGIMALPLPEGMTEEQWADALRRDLFPPLKPEIIEAWQNEGYPKKIETGEFRGFEIPDFWLPESEHLTYAIKRLCDEYHDELRLKKIAVVVKRSLGEPDADGVSKYAKASKMSDDKRLLSGFDFEIIIGFLQCADLDLGSLLWLLDHELEHCACNEETDKARMRKHPIECFPEVDARWGMHSLHYRAIVEHQAYRQGDLFREKAPPPVAANIEPLRELLDNSGTTMTLETAGRSATLRPRGKKGKAAAETEIGN
jgi:hypothetical protein